MHFKINVKQTLRLYHILNHWLTSNVKLLGNGPTTYVTDNTCEHIWTYIKLNLCWALASSSTNSFKQEIKGDRSFFWSKSFQLQLTNIDPT